MGSKTRWVIVIAVMLAAAFYFRPVWWESYRYENDQVRVRLGIHDGTRASDLSGTLVIRLTGPGRPYCGWDPISPKRSGPSREQLLRFDSVTSSVTDTDGYADAAPHAGIGYGERGLLMGGCRYDQGYILILSRPGFDTRILRPDVKKVNQAGQVLHQARPRKAKTSEFDYARRRLGLAINLLYPSPIFHDQTERGRRYDLMIVESMPTYWQHRLPHGGNLRDYAIEIVREVSQEVGCPAIADGVAAIFANNTGIPETDDEILAEHRALARLVQLPDSNAVTCR